MRSKNEGSVYQRADGLWVGSVNVGYSTGDDGKPKRIRKTVSAKTKAAAVAKLRELLGTVSTGVVTDDRVTVSAWLDQWESITLAASDLKESTRSNYSANLQHARQYLGGVRLVDLSKRDVERMLVRMKTDGKSANTRRLARTVLRMAVQAAYEERIVPMNVVTLAKGPKIDDAKTGRTLKLEEARKLKAAASESPLDVFVNVGLTLGLRPGETLALRWEDIDLDGRRLHVTGTLSRTPRGLERSSPKTKTSLRNLRMSPEIVATFQRQKVRQAKAKLAAGVLWTDSGYVNTSELGTPMDPANMRHRFDALCMKVLGERWTPHEMRHSAASLLLADRVPLRAISEILGHSSIKVTSDVYGHMEMAAYDAYLDQHSARIS